MTDRTLPTNGELLGLAVKYPTNQALADFLGVPRTTLRDHITRVGMRDTILAARLRGDHGMASPDDGMRLLLIDIETRPGKAWFFSTRDQFIPADRIIEPVATLCWAA